MIAIAGNIWDQIEQKELCNNFREWKRVKFALGTFTYSYTNIYDKQFSYDKKRINTTKTTSSEIYDFKIG